MTSITMLAKLGVVAAILAAALSGLPAGMTSDSNWTAASSFSAPTAVPQLVASTDDSLRSAAGEALAEVRAAKRILSCDTLLREQAFAVYVDNLDDALQPYEQGDQSAASLLALAAKLSLLRNELVAGVSSLGPWMALVRVVEPDGPAPTVPARFGLEENGVIAPPIDVNAELDHDLRLSLEIG